VSQRHQSVAGNALAWEHLLKANFDLGEKRKTFDPLPKARRRLPSERLRWKALEGFLLLPFQASNRAAALLEMLVHAKKSSKKGKG
jgi:hypothetical protein